MFDIEEQEGKMIKSIIKKNKKLVIKLAALIIVIFIIGVFLLVVMTKKENPPEIISESSLKKMLNISELSTFESIYNGVAEVYSDEEKEKLDFYVAYKSKVQAGFDLNDVKIKLNEEERTITLTMPEIKITDIVVDIDSLEYMFVNKNANTSAVTARAYPACISDAEEEANKEKAIYELAEENAERILRALISPFVEQIDSEYDIIIQ